MPFLPLLTGFSVIHIKLGAPTNSPSLILCSLQRCLEFIHFMSHLSPAFSTPREPTPPLLSPPVHQKSIYLLPHTHTIKGCPLVRTPNFLSLHPMAVFKSSFASSSQITVPESGSVLSKANPCAYKTKQTGAAPLVKDEAKFQWPHREGLRKEIPQSHSLTVFFSCWCFPSTESNWKEESKGAHWYNP